MKRYIMFIFLLAAIASLLVTTAHAEEPTPTVTYTPTSTTTEFNPNVIIEGLTINFFITLIITLIAGAVGGIVYELIVLQGNIERPHKPSEKEAEKHPYAIVDFLFDLGIWARIIIGGLAGVAAVFLLSPSTTFGLLAIAVVAGSAGISIFRSMQDRLIASIAQKDASETKKNASEQNDIVEEAIGAFAELKNKLVSASTSPVGTNTLSFGGTSGGSINLELDDIDKVERLLFEAKGVFKRI